MKVKSRSCILLILLFLTINMFSQSYEYKEYDYRWKAYSEKNIPNLFLGLNYAKDYTLSMNTPNEGNIKQGHNYGISAGYQISHAYFDDHFDKDYMFKSYLGVEAEYYPSKYAKLFASVGYTFRYFAFLNRYEFGIAKDLNSDKIEMQSRLYFLSVSYKKISIMWGLQMGISDFDNTSDIIKLNYTF